MRGNLSPIKARRVVIVVKKGNVTLKFDNKKKGGYKFKKSETRGKDRPPIKCFLCDSPHDKVSDCSSIYLCYMLMTCCLLSRTC